MPKCSTCEDARWVCEAHHGRPWGAVSNSPFACDCGAGDPCPECNQPEGDEPPRFPPNVTPVEGR